MTTQESIQLALAHHRAGRLHEAEAIYRQVLSRQPDYPDALHLLGMVAHQSGRHDQAVALMGRAIAADPGAGHYHANLGAVLATSGKFAQAIPHFEKAVELRPHDADARNHLASAYVDLGNTHYARKEMDQAARNYQLAATLRPADPATHYNLGIALAALEQAEQAAASFLKAISLRPDYSEAHAELADVLRAVGRHQEAGELLRKAVQLQPNNVKAINSLGNIYKDEGDLPKSLECYRRAVELDPSNAVPDSNRIYTLIFDPQQDAQSLLREAKLWNQRHAQPLERLIRPHQNSRQPDRRLRIGYVSPNLREHSQAPFILPLLRRHDHGNFEIFCYCDVPHPDAVTAKIQSCADTWRMTAKLTDESLAELIRGDAIDVLVDLTMHMSKSRLLVFARKPAPVQVAWLAYPGSTGVAAIGYRFTDAHLDPPGSDDSYTEKSIRLPRTFACFDAGALEAGWPNLIGPPAEQNGYVTFGCLNNFCKINEPLLGLWSGVLKSTPLSRLRLLAPAGAARQWVLQTLAGFDVPAHRIDFVLPQPRRLYLEELNHIDICLDTLPYSGHTTSLDAMWMGVAVVTRLGRTAAGRAGLSLAVNLKLTELVAEDDRQFVRIAADLAADPSRLSELRRTLRQRVLDSPIADHAGFARDVEAAYRAMWRELIHS